MGRGAPAAIYLAGPHGFTEAGRLYQAEVLIPALERAGFGVLDPWAVDGDTLSVLSAPRGSDLRAARLVEINRVMGNRNAKMIRDCDGVLAVLDGPDVDSGTAAEIGYAAAMRKKVVGLRSDIRVSGDNEATIVNLQVEWFIIESGGTITTHLDEALAAL